MARLAGEFSDLWQGKELRKRNHEKTGRKDSDDEVRRTAQGTGMGGKAPSSVNTAAGRKKNVADLTTIIPNW